MSETTSSMSVKTLTTTQITASAASVTSHQGGSSDLDDDHDLHSDIDFDFNNDDNTPITVVCALQCFLIVVLIVPVLIIMFIQKSHKKSSRTAFVVSLLASDLLVGVVIIPLHITREYLSSMDEGFCHAMVFLRKLTVCANLYCVAVIAVDRYFSIVHSTRYKPSGKKVAMAIACVWVFSIATALVDTLNSESESHLHEADDHSDEIEDNLSSFFNNSIGFYDDDDDHSDEEEDDHSDEEREIEEEGETAISHFSCGPVEAHVRYAILLFDFIVVCLVPIILTVAIYIRVVYWLFRQTSAGLNTASIRRRNISVLRMVLSITVCYAALQLPVVLWKMYVFLGPETAQNSASLAVYDALLILTYCNSITNVVAYVFFNDSIRKALTRPNKIMPNKVSIATLPSNTLSVNSNSLQTGDM